MKNILQVSLHYLIADSLQYIMDRMNRSCGYVSNKIEYINTYATFQLCNGGHFHKDNLFDSWIISWRVSIGFT